MKKGAKEKAKAENETKPTDGKAENKTEKAEKVEKVEKNKKPVIVTLKEPITANEEKLGPRVLSGEKLTASQEK